MSDEIHVKAVDEIAVWTSQSIEGAVSIVGAGYGCDQAQAAANAMHVCIDRHGGKPQTEQQNAAGGFRSNARECFEPHPRAIKCLGAQAIEG